MASFHVQSLCGKRSQAQQEVSLRFVLYLAILRCTVQPVRDITGFLLGIRDYRRHKEANKSLFRAFGMIAGATRPTYTQRYNPTALPRDPFWDLLFF